jgi:hypothetical protein
MNSMRASVLYSPISISIISIAIAITGRIQQAAPED